MNSIDGDQEAANCRLTNSRRSNRRACQAGVLLFGVRSSLFVNLRSFRNVDYISCERSPPLHQGDGNLARPCERPEAAVPKCLRSFTHTLIVGPERALAALLRCILYNAGRTGDAGQGRLPVHDLPQGLLERPGGNGWECRTSTWATRSYALFAETLHQLCHIGSAYKDNPNIVL
jgi:hypothetical protein